MSGMDDRAKQFKTAAESQPTGPALKKEVNTLRRFLFRNQEYRFTKAAQQALYMAVLAHYGNPATHHASGYSPAVPTASTSDKVTATPNVSMADRALATATAAATTTAPRADPANTVGCHSDNEDDANDGTAAEAPVLRLLDDALKMPFTVFSSAQKDKLLALYWTVLGTEGPSGAGKNAGAAAAGGAGAADTTLTLSLMDIVDVGKKKAHLSLFTDDGDEYAQEVLVDDAATLQQLKKAFSEGSEVTVVVAENDTGARFVSFTVGED